MNRVNSFTKGGFFFSSRELWWMYRKIIRSVARMLARGIRWKKKRKRRKIKPIRFICLKNFLKIYENVEGFSPPQRGKAKPSVQELEYRNWNTGIGIQELEYRNWNTGLGQYRNWANADVWRKAVWEEKNKARAKKRNYGRQRLKDFQLQRHRFYFLTICTDSKKSVFYFTGNCKKMLKKFFSKCRKI